jgi:hypothetical protein
MRSRGSRFCAGFIRPGFSSGGRAVRTENIGGNLKKIHQPRGQVLAEDFGHILEANVHVGFVPDRIEFNKSPVCRERVVPGDLRSTAQEKTWFDHKSAFCFASSLRNLFMATARNPEAFLRSIPF